LKKRAKKLIAKVRGGVRRGGVEEGRSKSYKALSDGFIHQLDKEVQWEKKQSCEIVISPKGRQREDGGLNKEGTQGEKKERHPFSELVVGTVKHTRKIWSGWEWGSRVA